MPAAAAEHIIVVAAASVKEAMTKPTTPVTCRHMSRCHLTATDGRCCMCSDSRARGADGHPSPCSAAVATHRAKGRSATTLLFYSWYCPGCSSSFSAKATARRAECAKRLQRWLVQPSSEGVTSALFTNWALRSRRTADDARRERSLPFDLAHVVMDFLVPAYVAFRRANAAGGRRGAAEISAAAATLTARGLRSAAFSMPSWYVGPYSSTPLSVAASSCTHSYCQLSLRTRAGCCACQDKRPQKDVDVVYIDGRGDTLIHVPFWQHYCAGCRDFHRSAPQGRAVF